MRILSVRFLNLNSLKGEHQIRFDESPFTESGLFAITGPTGAGKTTILDAITIALYGRIHRHDKDVSESMTRHTAESFSEVEFEMKGKAYRTKWSQRRGHGKVHGTLQTQKMELVDLSTSEIIVNHPLSEVQQQIVNLCGLDYSQFLRSVMLSQGDFTQFLKSKENERSELLEKITDTTIYSEISKGVYLRARDEKEKLERLKEQLNNTEILSEEEVSGLNISLQDMSVQERAVRDQSLIIRNQVNWLSNLSKLQIEEERHALHLVEQENMLTQHQEDFQKLVRHKKAMSYRPELQDIDSRQQRLQELALRIEQQEEALPELKEQLRSAVQTFEDGKTLLNQKEQNEQEKGLLFEKVIQKDALLEGFRKEFERAGIWAKNALKDVDASIAERDELAKAFVRLEAKIEELNQMLASQPKESELEKAILRVEQYHHDLLRNQQSLQLKEQEEVKMLGLGDEVGKNIIAINSEWSRVKVALEQKTEEMAALRSRLQVEFEGKSLETLEASADALPSLISYCQEQWRLSKEYAQTVGNLATLALELKHTGEVLLDRETELTQLVDEKNGAELILEDYRRMVDIQIRIQKYDADRGQLQEDQECPLCGSTEHPYVEKHYQSELSVAEVKRNTHEAFVQKLARDLQVLQVALAAAKQKQASQIEQSAELEARLIDIQESFRLNNLHLPAALSIEKSPTIEAIIKKKQGELAGLQAQIHALRLLQKDISQSEQSLIELKGAMEQAETRKESLLTQETAVNESQDRVKLEVQQLRLEIAGLESNVKGILEGLQIKEPLEDIVQSLNVRLRLCRESNEKLQDAVLQRQQVSAQLTSMEKAILEKQEILRMRDKELKQAELRLHEEIAERRELFGEKDPVQEREHLQNDLKRTRELQESQQELRNQLEKQVSASEASLKQDKEDIDKLMRGLESLKGELNGKLRQEGIADLAELRSFILEGPLAERLFILEDQITKSIANVRHLLENVRNELILERARALTEATAEELQDRLRSLEASISDLNQQIGGVKARLQADFDTKIRFKAITDQLIVQQGEHERWQKIASLIGSDNGKKFSNFAQGLTLARLTELANLHLQKLSDRYRILKSPSKDLEIQIVDGYQADVVRPMTTLSGGESFLVSLALALGLSDLASRKTKIDSLFIDEGFGTLDADTLDIAISALENLQANGKTIGIISHVEALKERIGTQVQVSKQPGGVSKIRVVSYGEVLG